MKLKVKVEPYCKGTVKEIKEIIKALNLRYDANKKIKFVLNERHVSTGGGPGRDAAIDINLARFCGNYPGYLSIKRELESYYKELTPIFPDFMTVMKAYIPSLEQMEENIWTGKSPWAENEDDKIIVKDNFEIWINSTTLRKGDLISFIMKIENISYFQAIVFLKNLKLEI